MKTEPYSSSTVVEIEILHFEADERTPRDRYYWKLPHERHVLARGAFDTRKEAIADAERQVERVKRKLLKDRQHCRRGKRPSA